MFLYDKEFKNFRLRVRSNEISTSFYLEQLIDGFTAPSEIKATILNIYFYFFGSEKLDLIKLIESFEKDWSDLDFNTLRDTVLSFLSTRLTGSDFAFSEKKVSIFQIKPRTGTVIKVKGRDFKGRILWNSFFFLSDKKQLCICRDIESANKLFIIFSDLNQIRSSMSYKNLIKVLIDNRIKIIGGV